jgi:hypothetical protein
MRKGFVSFTKQQTIYCSFDGVTDSFLTTITLSLTFKKREKSWYVIMGMIFSLGIWNRFTFVFFILPFPFFIFWDFYCTSTTSGFSHVWKQTLTVYCDVFLGTSMFVNIFSLSLSLSLSLSFSLSIKIE